MNNPVVMSVECSCRDSNRASWLKCPCHCFIDKRVTLKPQNCVEAATLRRRDETMSWSGVNDIKVSAFCEDWSAAEPPTALSKRVGNQTASCEVSSQLIREASGEGNCHLQTRQIKNSNALRCNANTCLAMRQESVCRPNARSLCLTESLPRRKDVEWYQPMNMLIPQLVQMTNYERQFKFPPNLKAMGRPQFFFASEQEAAVEVKTEIAKLAPAEEKEQEEITKIDDPADEEPKLKACKRTCNMNVYTHAH